MGRQIVAAIIGAVVSAVSCLITECLFKKGVSSDAVAGAAGAGIGIVFLSWTFIPFVNEKGRLKFDLFVFASTIAGGIWVALKGPH